MKSYPRAQWGNFPLALFIRALYRCARSLIIAGTFSIIITAIASGAPALVASTFHAEANRVGGQVQLANIPINFIPNVGQWDAKVCFQARVGNYAIFFSSRGVLFAADLSSVIQLQFVGANPNPAIEGLKKLPGTANFFLGNDEKKWHTNVPTYGAIVYKEIYPGIDLIYRGEEGHLKGEFIVSPGADPSQIRLSYKGAKEVRLQEDGTLIVKTGFSKLIEAAPVIYQVIEGKRVAIEGGYRLSKDNQVMFTLGEYDPKEPLFIDPMLVYSTYLGGSESDGARGIAVDTSGNVYITGFTNSSDFPTKNPQQVKFGGPQPLYVTSIGDAFVVKIDPSGSVVYSTYLGGKDSDEGEGIAVDVDGNAFVIGWTYSANFPTKNPLQSHGGFPDAFVAELDSLGALVYSTYLGGSDADEGYGIAVGSSGNVYVTGWTYSTNFPIKDPLQAEHGGKGMDLDAFVTEISSTGALVYSTYLGGSDADEGHGIAVDSSGNAYITGETASADFPTKDPLQPHLGGGVDAFITKMSPSGSLVYSTYLGGSSADEGYDIAVDSPGNAYVTGSTRSTNLATKDAFQTHIHVGGGDHDAFVAKLSSSGSLAYFTYLGGSAPDSGLAIAVDTSGDAYVAGGTWSFDFPTKDPLQLHLAGGDDAFVAKLTPSGSILLYSTYLGGKGKDAAYDVAVDSSGNAYVTGETRSTDFPTKNPLQEKIGGNQDAFLVKISASTTPAPGFINGQVTDALTNKGIAGAAVMATPMGIPGYSEVSPAAMMAPQTPSATTTTNASGNYSLEVPEGTYEVIVDAQGYEGQKKSNVTVTAGETTTVNFSLTPTTTDTTPPALITDFSASDGEDGQSTLRWTNPSDSDLAEVIVRRKTSGYPTNHTDGDIAYQNTSPTPGASVSYADTGLTNGITYYYAVFSCDTTGNWNDQVVKGKNADKGTPGLENHPPIAHAADISGQPQMMYPNITYTVTAKYFDPNGRQDLKICYLRLNHPTKPLTMMWYQVDGHTSTYAGEEGENYLTKVGATASEITGADGTQGYEIKWTFEINNKWPEVQNAIDFGVFASDDEGLESNWDYTDTNASFRSIFLVIASPLKISPAQNIYSVGDSILATFTIENKGSVPVNLNVLTVGGRLNGSCLPGGCPDFTHRSVTLGAGESYQYEGHLTLSHAGTYHFFCVYKLNGVWNANISVELNGQIVEDPAVAQRCREADIRVIEGATISTALGPASWEPIKGPWDKWPEDKLGSSWNIIQAIAVNPKNPNEIYVAATHRTNNWWEPEGSRLYKSIDGGKSWSDISEGLPRLHLSSYYWPIGAIAIAPSNPNVVYVGTTDFDPNNVDILAGPSHSMGVYKTINGGQSWLEWNGGSQLSPPPGSTPPIVIPSFPTAYSVSSMTVDPTNADIVYVGTVGGGIWSTVTVGGEIGWQQVWKPRGRLLYNVNSLAISPDNPSTIYAAAYNYAPYSGSGFSGLAFHGGLYKYTNGAWQNINNKRRIDDIVITKQNANNIFIITNSYEAFQSVDGGMTWQDITGRGEDSLPQVYLDLPYAKPSYSLEMDPNSKWLFAASPFGTQAMGVYFSPNLGRNWFPIGLQDESVTQLALASTSEHHILYAVTTRSTQEDVHLFKYEFSNSAVVVERGSPVEVRVYDTDGHVSGVVNGQQKAEIPKSLVVGETITILSSTGPYKYEVFGTDKGTYNLDITSIHNNDVSAFVATNIPTHRGAVHKYTINRDALSKGKKGVTGKIDENGDGKFDKTITAGPSLKGENTPRGKNVLVDFPNVGVNLTFSDILSAGGTFLSPISELPFNLRGLKFLGKFYHFDTTAPYKGPIKVKIHYDDTGLSPEQEKNLRLYRIEDNGTITDITTAVDTQNNFVTGNTSGFSYFAVGTTSDTTPPPAPEISSSTHPDQTKWYDNNDPSFSWTEPDDPSGIVGYSYIIDHNAGTTPDTTVDTMERTKSYTDLADGTWYFHVRAEDGAGNWGEATSYRINIDTSLPTAEITFPQGGSAIRGKVNVTGTAAGGDFDHYYVDTARRGEGWTRLFSAKKQVSAGTLATWDTSAVPDGEYTIRLTVVDTHDLSSESSVGVKVDNTPPVIKDIVPVRGDFASSTPTISATLMDNLSGIDETTITLTLNGEKVDPAPSFDPKTGRMTWTAQEPLPNGDYEVTIDVKDKAGNEAVEAKTSFTISTKIAIKNALNYPNPCSSGTTFTYNLSQEAKVRIEIYTLAGELIKVIDPASGEVGYNEQYWDGTDDQGQELGNGVYLYRIVAEAGGKVAQVVEKLAVLR